MVVFKSYNVCGLFEYINDNMITEKKSNGVRLHDLSDQLTINVVYDTNFPYFDNKF